MLINDFVLSRATSPQYMTQRDIKTGLETLELVHIVWIGLGQSLSLNSLWTPPPPTHHHHHTNFLGTSKLHGKLIFGMHAFMN